ncbi:MAG: hypothetical protein QG641_2470, partial [Candidatus Poribacteria bacterium]|nr:hypothetical protein [Candidatus Poribacteria bacterium]
MEKNVKKAVRDSYARIAKRKGSCCDSTSSC